jgi:uncharacterized UBP type Zn finger protein
MKTEQEIREAAKVLWDNTAAVVEKLIQMGVPKEAATAAVTVSATAATALFWALGDDRGEPMATMLRRNKHLRDLYMTGRG